MTVFLTDKALLKSADEQLAFRMLYERYWEELYKKAFRRLNHEEDAEDVVQEIFISLWRNRHTIEVQESIAPYLFTALKYGIIKIVQQKAKKGILLPLSLVELEDHLDKSDEILECREMKSRIDQEVEGLPDRMRQIYQLSRVQHLKNGEIAQMLRISEQTVKNTLVATLKRLKSKVLLFITFLF